ARILARSIGSSGTRRSAAGNTSSRYSMITEESMIARPSCSSDGTTPFGLTARYSGLSWSPAKRSSLRSSNGRPFACNVKRTRWLQVDCGALKSTSSVMVFTGLRSAHHGGSLPEQDLARLLGDARRRVDRLRQLVNLHGRGPRLDRLEPALEVGEVLELLALPLPRHDPRIARHVGDRVFAGDEIAAGELLVEHAIEPVDLVDVALGRVGNPLGGVVGEVVVLPAHRPKAAHLPEQPLDGLVALARVGGEELAGLLGEIDQHRARFEHRDRLAAVLRLVVDQRRNAVVGRDRQELRLELLALADVDRNDLVLESGLLEEHRDLVAFRRGPIVQLDHGQGSSYCHARACPAHPRLA